MTKIWEKSIECAQEIERLFEKTGELVKQTTDERLGIKIGRAHV